MEVESYRETEHVIGICSLSLNGSIFSTFIRVVRIPSWAVYSNGRHSQVVKLRSLHLELSLAEGFTKPSLAA